MSIEGTFKVHVFPEKDIAAANEMQIEQDFRRMVEYSDKIAAKKILWKNVFGIIFGRTTQEQILAEYGRNKNGLFKDEQRYSLAWVAQNDPNLTKYQDVLALNNLHLTIEQYNRIQEKKQV